MLSAGVEYRCETQEPCKVIQFEQHPIKIGCERDALKMKPLSLPPTPSLNPTKPPLLPSGKQFLLAHCQLTLPPPRPPPPPPSRRFLLRRRNLQRVIPFGNAQARREGMSERRRSGPLQECC